ncbi:MAG: hypothetical protein LUF87_09340 [Alistipes sp.]|nr:hypothetical protein [Alistipes sp.]
MTKEKRLLHYVRNDGTGRFGMTEKSAIESKQKRHCEERSDVAISWEAQWDEIASGC